MGPTGNPHLSSQTACPRCAQHAADPPVHLQHQMGGLTGERLLRSGVHPSAQYRDANKRCSKMFVGGRRGRKQQQKRAARKVSIPPGAGSLARTRKGGRVAKDKSLCGQQGASSWKVRSHITEWGAPNSPGFPLLVASPRPILWPGQRPESSAEFPFFERALIGPLILSPAAHGVQERRPGTSGRQTQSLPEIIRTIRNKRNHKSTRRNHRLFSLLFRSVLISA